jgi:hypothetical protein
MGVPDQRSRIATRADHDGLGTVKQCTHERQVGSQRDLAWRDRTIGRRDPTLGRQVREQRVLDVRRRHTERCANRRENVLARTSGAACGFVEDPLTRATGWHGLAAHRAEEPVERGDRQGTRDFGSREPRRFAQARVELATATADEPFVLVE